MLYIQIVDPRDAPGVVTEFCGGQVEAYSEFAAEKAVAPITEQEVEKGCVRFVVARERLTGTMVGGLRLYLRPPGCRLPVERLLNKYTALIEQIEMLAPQGIAEIGGAWAHRRWRGTGLSLALFRVATAGMPELNVTRALAFSHDRVYPAWGPLGWWVDNSFGSLNYPDERYQTSIIWIDPFTLRNSAPKQRALTIAFRRTLKRMGYVQWSPSQDVIKAKTRSAETQLT